MRGQFRGWALFHQGLEILVHLSRQLVLEEPRHGARRASTYRRLVRDSLVRNNLRRCARHRPPCTRHCRRRTELWPVVHGWSVKARNEKNLKLGYRGTNQGELPSEEKARADTNKVQISTWALRNKPKECLKGRRGC